MNSSNSSCEAIPPPAYPRYVGNEWSLTSFLTSSNSQNMILSKTFSFVKKDAMVMSELINMRFIQFAPIIKIRCGRSGID